MAVQVGQTLDKYELLERVGQGGMAVVYRGRDSSLRREVAVKVLHQHLAEHKEARDRFEREAHAVAKLRHENILEIYDFSGTESDESYIVTEFIDGQSLKEFITGHAIKYPEIGAMIAVQVCRALQHAHAAGILHRDVKPENIMIRTDGVVKLTDFGIAQMIDLQRLTVTGQLLGSPAYMSPEHVNGGQLDFRTDVFAVGIVLYQLVTGELPFKGKNPHEILKKIAEGRFLDPAVVNPLVGKSLARIIKKSLAKEKDDRYADVSQMLAALERFLADSGLSSYREELGRYFVAPASYEMALKERLVDHLARRGKSLVATDQLEALDTFNRVLTMEPDHAEVLAEIDRLGQKKRAVRLLTMAAGVVLAVGLVFGAKTMLARSAGPVAMRGDVPPLSMMTPDGAPPDAGAIADAAVEPAADAAVELAVIDAAPRRIDPDERIRRKRDAAVKRPAPDAAVEAVSTRVVRLTVFPPNGSEYRIAGGAWQTLRSPTVTVDVPTGPVTIEARNTTCCSEGSTTVAAEGGRAQINLRYRPATITPVCDRPGAEVLVDNQKQTLGTPVTVPIESLNGQTSIEVQFLADANFYKKKNVSLKWRQTKKVTCD